MSERISGIEVVRDVVCVNDGNYEITFDMAIVIKCQTRMIIFSRGRHFSEVISVKSDIADVYPVASAVSGAVKRLVEAGILVQTNNAGRNRVFAYERYLEILCKDT